MTVDIKDVPGGYIVNCTIMPRAGETAVRGVAGNLAPTLDGYHIVPSETFVALVKLAAAWGDVKYDEQRRGELEKLVGLSAWTRPDEA